MPKTDGMSDPILIIGAGVGGLALAQGLLLNHIPFRIFERDSQLHARTQGYRVRISEEGVQALRQNLPEDRFDYLERCCRADVPLSSGNAAQAHLDANTAESSESLFKKGEPTPVKASGKPWSADRGALRSVLSLGLDTQLEYGKEMNSYEEDEEGVTVTFKDGSGARGRLLVGADGTWSKIRSQLLPAFTLVDTEGRLVYGKTEITDAFSDKFSPKAAAGMVVIRDSKTGSACLLESMRFNKSEPHTPNDYVYWVLFLRKDSTLPDEEMLRLSDAGVAQFIRALTANWHPQLRCLFDAFTASVTRVVSVRPPIPTWNSNSRVTLIGDAIHSMAPTAALGATTALQDAGVLTRLLVQHEKHDDKLMAFREYEIQMSRYAEEALHRTVMGGKMVFGMRPFDELPIADRGL